MEEIQLNEVLQKHFNRIDKKLDDYFNSGAQAIKDNYRSEMSRDQMEKTLRSLDKRGIKFVKKTLLKVWEEAYEEGRRDGRSEVTNE